MSANYLMSNESTTDLDSSSPPPAEDTLSTRGLLLGGLGFLALLTALYVIVQSIGIKNLQQQIADAGALGPLIFIAIKAITFTFAPLSAGPIQFASGLLFGVIEGTLYSVLGELIGGSINFWIARIYGRRLVKRFVGEKAMSRVDEFYERHLENWQSLLMARLFLFSVYDFISYAVGYSRINFATYLVISFFGGLIPTYIFVQIGSVAAQNQDVLLVFYIVGGIIFVAFVILRKPIQRYLNRLRSRYEISQN